MTAEQSIYTSRRMRSIFIVACVQAAIAFGLGYDRAALGAMAGSLVGLLNYYLIYSAAHKQDGADRSQMQVRLLLRSLSRMGISMLALLVALRFGPEFVIGVLAGVLSETATYMGDAVLLMLKRWR